MKASRITLSLLALAGVSAHHLASAQTVLTTSSWLPPTHTLSMVQKEWCDLVEKNSAGKVKCNILPCAVSAPPGTFDAVKKRLG